MHSCAKRPNEYRLEFKFNMRIPNKYLLITALLFIEIYGCKEKGTEPPSFKNPRDYVWTADTISYKGSFIQTTMFSIWGSSSNDIYGVGFNNAFENVKLWHYDGQRWTDIKLFNYQIWPTQLSAIYGFSSNDIWAAGWSGDLSSQSSGLIIHYDGSKWSEANINKCSVINDIWGSSPNDIWACGWTGAVYHFDGIKWNKDSISVYLSQGADFQLLNIRESNSVPFTTGIKVENNIARWTFYFFKKANQAWQTIDSFVVAPGQTTFKFGTRLWTSPNENVYSCSDGVFRWNGNSWEKIFTSSTSFGSIAGISEQNFFVVGDYGNVYHYNGSDWYQYQQLKNENIVYTGVWTDGNEAFICGFTTNGYPMKTIVWHGK